MLLSLISVTVALWASWARGQETTCDPPTIANGLYTPHRSKYRLEDVITYRCDNGFSHLSRGNKTRCTDGGWKPPPRCVFKPCEYPEIKHGSLYWADRYTRFFPAAVGQRFFYTCDDNYLTPSEDNWSRIICTPGGWLPNVPCLRKCVFNYLENGHYLRYEQNYLQGESVRVFCHPGYSLPDQRTTMTCTENGWSPPPKCIPVVTCSKSDIVIKNGFFSEPELIYPLHKETQYKCQQGYLTEDGQTSGTITCLQRGWSARPKCIKHCDMPLFENATAIITGKAFRPNDTLDYQCLDGHETRDGRTTGSMVCGEDGWSHLPSCFKSAEKCGPPPAVSNGDITSFSLKAYPPGSRVEYQCQAYYELRGPKYVTCSYAKWSEPPKCIETTCDPPAIANGLYAPNETKYRLEDVITYRCDIGFSRLSRGNKTRCTDGGWKPLPRCILESCEFPEIKHGVLYREDTYKTHFPAAVGQWYYYTCDDYYVNPLTQLNWAKITCTPDGWSPNVPCLRKCVFNYLEHGHSPPDGQTYLQGQSVSVTCHPDYSLPNQRTTMTCAENGWSPPPKCIKKKAPPRYNLFMIF